VGELFKDAGLKYAEFLPLPLATAVIAVVVVVYLWITLEEHGEESWKKPGRVALGVLAILVVIQYPVAYEKAKDYCRQQWEQGDGGLISHEPSLAYRVSKCANPWPQGPDGPPGLWTFPSF